MNATIRSHQCIFYEFSKEQTNQECQRRSRCGFDKRQIKIIVKYLKPEDIDCGNPPSCHRYTIRSHILTTLVTPWAIERVSWSPKVKSKIPDYRVDGR